MIFRQILLAIVTAFAAGSGVANDQLVDASITLILENHHFTPSNFSVSAGQRFRIQVTSHDPSVDEFESYDMKFEKIVVPGNTITVYAGPLHPGTYTFFDDYHPEDAKGTVTVTDSGDQANAR